MSYSPHKPISIRPNIVYGNPVNKKVNLPRYRVKSLWPTCNTMGFYKVGDILTDNGRDAVVNQEGHPVMPIAWEEFPALFELLPWYAEREAGEMPEYLRFQKDDEVYKIEKWDMKHLVGFIDINRRQGCSLLTWKPEHGYVPAT